MSNSIDAGQNLPEHKAFRVTNLSKSYYKDSKLTVLQNLNVDMDPGEVISIQGASGSGKSTLLNIIGAIDNYESGFVEVNGIDISTLTDVQKGNFRAHNIGFIFQAHLLLPDFSLQENVAIPMLVQRRSRAEAMAKAAELLELVGLGHRIGHYPGQVSGGEAQRTSIARSLAGGARLVLADEPTGNLDNKTSTSIVDLIWRLQSELNFSLVIVTHNDDLAKKAGRRLLLKDKRIEELAVTS